MESYESPEHGYIPVDKRAHSFLIIVMQCSLPLVFLGSVGAGYVLTDILWTLI